jgi:hypothetical protein
MKFVLCQKLLTKENQNLLSILSASLSTWLKSQATEEEVQEDGTVKQKMGKASLDMLNKLKSGSKTTIQKLKDEGSASQKFNKDNFDLITWFIISNK